MFDKPSVVVSSGTGNCFGEISRTYIVEII